MRKSIVCLLAAISSFAWAKEECREVNIALLPGEKWWGGAGADGQSQPYSGERNSREKNLNVHGSTSSPLLVSTCGRYVWCEKPFVYCFKDGVLKITARKNVDLEQNVAGKTLKEAYLAAAARHFRFEGKMPPEIMFAKPQWNNWIEIFLNGMTEKSVNDYTRELAQSGYACGIYMMDGGWMSHQGSYEFYDKDYPNPKEIFDLVRANGWIPMIWTAHFVSPDSREYKKLRYHKALKGLDYLAYEKRPGSKNAGVVRWWSGISAVYDLTKPAARDYYVKELKDFAARYGIAGFKFDAGDPHMFHEADIRFDDETAEGIDYTRLYAEMAAAEFPYNEIRVSWKCGGLPLATRLPDRMHTWEHQRTIIPQIITAGLLGCPYSIADMVGGGMEVSFRDVKFGGGKVDEKLVVRSAALHALMPMMQFSLAPWRHLSPRGNELCKRFTALREEFVPYILECARHAAKTGEPIVRAMEYEFPAGEFANSRAQFMLGGRYLVAPVMNADDSTTVELPRGLWKDDLGEEIAGPKVLHLTGVPLERLPRYELLGGR
ncbi:MAG: glycoside hydrolase family 31 protein [Kiritimatiellia bacterium]